MSKKFIDKRAQIGSPKRQSTFKFSRLKGSIQFSFEGSRIRVNLEKVKNKTIIISQANANALASWIMAHKNE
jgi:hypothetical protein